MVNKLNKVGMEVLEYKQELLNPDHKDIVRKALVSAITDLMHAEVIDREVFESLKDDEDSEHNTKLLILEKANLCKSTEELIEEYDTLRVPFEEELLERDELQNPKLHPMKTENDIENDEVHLVVDFGFGKDFVSDYFGKDGQQLELLMEDSAFRRVKGSFAGRFLLMRLKKIASDFLKKQEGYNESTGRVELTDNMSVAMTKVYINTDEQVHGIELVAHIEVDALESESYTELFKPLEDIILKANEYVEVRTLV